MLADRSPFLLLVCLLVLAAPALAETEQFTASKDANAFKALFIGNSLTYYYSLPNTLATFIESGVKRPTKISDVIVGGFTLRQHWNEGVAQKQIRGDAPWDYVVLQGQSRESFADSPNFVAYGKKFARVIEEAHAKPVLFQTYALKGLKDYQAKIHTGYDLLGREIKATVVPVGDAFFFVQKSAPEINLYDPDDKHPSKAGTYLAALVFYEFLLNKSPIGLPAKIPDRISTQHYGYEIAAGDAHRLQDLAWKFYLAHRRQK